MGAVGLRRPPAAFWGPAPSGPRWAYWPAKMGPERMGAVARFHRSSWAKITDLEDLLRETKLGYCGAVQPAVALLSPPRSTFSARTAGYRGAL